MSFLELMRGHYFDLIGSGALWFTKTLLVFSFLVILIPEKFFRRRDNSNPFKFLPVLCFALSTGILAFLLRLVIPVGVEVWELQLGYYVLYIALFFYGVTASVNSDFDHYPKKKVLPWIITSIIAFLSFPIIMILSMKAETPIEQFMGGFNLLAFFYAVWEPFIAIGIMFSIWKISLKFINTDLKIAVSSYGAYILHPIVIILISLLFHKVQLQPLLKFIIVGTLSVVICYTTSHLLRKIPGMKKVI